MATQAELNADAEIWLASYLRWYNRKRWEERLMAKPTPSRRPPPDPQGGYDTREERDMDRE